MYGIQFAYMSTNYLSWYGIINDGLIPIVAKSSGWSEASMAALLGSFALGYVPVQIPASLIARKVGEKLVILINLVANGTLCLAAPTLARRGGPAALYVCLALMGIFQGCRVPCNAAMDARWLPDGPERCVSLSLQCMPYTCSSHH